MIDLEELALKINEIFFSIQGESTLAGKPTVFVRTATCNLRCTWCMAPETPVLMADLTYRSIGDLKEGDEIVGFSQVPGLRQRRMVRTRVLALSRREGIARIQINTKVGSLVCTPDHKIWHADFNGKSRFGRWRKAERFSPGEGIRTFHVPRVPKPDREAFALGYLSGAADGDGCFWDFAPSTRKKTYLRFRIAANDMEMLQRFRECGEMFGFEFSTTPHTHTGFAGPSKMHSLYLLGGDAQVNSFHEKISPSPLYRTNTSFLRGYLSGIFDAEGSLSCGNLRISQSDVNLPIKEQIVDFATSLGFRAVVEPKGVLIAGGLNEHLRFFALCEPAISRKRGEFFGRAVKTSTEVTSIGPAEIGPVITMSTECGSFVADGLVVKNCDTKYSYWQGRLMTADEILTQVKTFDSEYVCLTGGEPLGQKGTIRLMEKLLEAGYIVSLETNGSFSIVDVPLAVIKVVDIKCPDSGESENMAWENLKLVKEHDQFKFVVASRADFDWAQKIAAEHQLHEKCTILFSPAYGKVKPSDLASWILKAKAPVTMQVQLHKEIWGPKERGV